MSKHSFVAVDDKAASHEGPSTARAVLDKAMTERELFECVRDYFKLFGWFYYHTYDSRKSSPGFPDIVAVRERVLFIELKRQNGEVSQAQAEWFMQLAMANAERYLWRPSDLSSGLIERVLQDGRGV